MRTFLSDRAWRRHLLGLAAVVLIVGTTSVPRSLVAGQATRSRASGPDLSPQAIDADLDWMKALAVMNAGEDPFLELARCTLGPRY